MAKRITALFLAVVLICALLPPAALTASAKTYSGTCGDDITWEVNTDTGELVISGTGEMYHWNSYSDVPWHTLYTTVETVSISDGVTSIGNYAFYQFHKITSVTIPDSVAEFGFEAFYQCTALRSVSIPQSLTDITDRAFCSCFGLTSVTIPSSVTRIGNSAFIGCVGLASIAIPESVTIIGEFAFSGCSGLTSVTIPNGVAIIEAGTFRGCNGLTSVQIGSGVTTLGRGAFSNCTGLTSITLPDSTMWIGGHAFEDCSNLKELTIPGSVKSIGYGAFHGCDSLTDVYYGGTQKEWMAIKIDEDNSQLKAVSMHYLEDPDTPPFIFADLTESAWYYEAVKYVVTNGLMNGMSIRSFAPEASMTRAMLVTVLWRYEDSPQEGINKFTDVPDDQWYADAVAWAAANGIVGGVGNGKFDPNSKITREQMAAILYRYAQKIGIDTGKRGDLSKFPDASRVSDWAKEAIAWAVAEGIIGGSDGKLLPQGNATRAQVATILMRFIETFAEKIN